MYDTVLFDQQCWMAENLNMGTMVLGTTDMTDNAVIEKYCYDNNTDYCVNEGGLYWTSTQSVTSACSRTLGLGDDTVNRGMISKQAGRSLRCIKDAQIFN